MAACGIDVINMTGKAGRSAGRQPKKAAFLNSRACQQVHLGIIMGKSTNEEFHIARYHHLAMLNEFQELLCSFYSRNPTFLNLNISFSLLSISYLSLHCQQSFLMINVLLAKCEGEWQ